MALGFGFNKVKVLSSAEKYVQQGKIQNAIHEYEKVSKHDPKDLAILNTLGDLYARMGQPDRAASYFKRVGEAYAADGFTVKAIAIYKKITKIAPVAADSIRRLAELYARQNLLTDARQQYLQLAEQYVKSGNLEAAVDIFHKMLELDPDNSAMQTRLAELYIRMGKKDQAQEIFSRAAQSLLQRGAIEAADEALSRVLSISPGNPQALMLRAHASLEAGNAAAAVRHLESIPNIDSSVDGLTSLLRARLALAQPDEAEPLVRKLLTVHNELGGMNHFAEWLVARGEFERALRMYSEHSDRLLASNPAPLLSALRTVTERVKENAPALEMVLGLLQKMGEQGPITEVIELLAHALVQQGDFARARDLYRDLAVLEPENPVHDQNYRQMVSRLGEDPALRALTPQQAGQAFMVDELEVSAPLVPQEHPQEVADSVSAAVTEAELLESYSMLSKAIATLEAVLPMAPSDTRMNQRLASLYARSGCYEQAAHCCDVLASVYREAGHVSQSSEYRELAARYRERTVLPPEIQAPPAQFAVTTVTADPGTHASVLPEFQIEIPSAASPTAFSVTVPTQPAAAEMDISDEWEPASQHSQAVEDTLPDSLIPGSVEPDFVVELEEPEVSPVAELLEEVRFYVGQQMWEEAAAVADKCSAIAPGLPELDELHRQIAAGSSAAAAEGTSDHLLSDAIAIEYEVEKASAALTRSNPVSNGVIPSKPETVAQPAASGDLLENLVAGLEHSLGDDYTPGGKSSISEVAASLQAAVLPAVERDALGHEQDPSIAAPPPVPMPGDVLSEMFEEFREGAEAAPAEAEDPENHYNLGIAFREMGLLDEAIGELQKVAQSVENRHAFRDTLQVYTLLGQCFVDKGIPEAAIRWYERALQYTPDADSRIAVHYELGSAHQAAGSHQAALKHFLEVYGTNIDYRDVAERIQGLKS